MGVEDIALASSWPSASRLSSTAFTRHGQFLRHPSRSGIEDTTVSKAPLADPGGYLSLASSSCPASARLMPVTQPSPTLYDPTPGQTRHGCQVELAMLRRMQY